MHFRKFAAGLLAAMALAAALPGAPAAAAEETYDGITADGNFSYTLLDDGIAVYCENPALEQANVPEIIDGYKVTALADGCFSESVYITEVILPEGLTSIGEDAFLSCDVLTAVSIPETVTAIGANAFYGCSALTEINIPASVTDIGDYAFDTTESMTAFHVAEDNPSYSDVDGVLFDKNAETIIKYPEARPDTSYALPASCKTVANWAFVGSQHLEQVDLGQVTAIGEDAFYYCIKLKSIDIPEGVTELVGAAFCYCVELESVTLPSTLESIGENCFYSCTALKDVVLPEGLKKIGGYAFFHCTSLESLNIPKSVETIVGYCIGYYYDEGTAATALQENFTAYVTKGTPGYTYADSNGLTVETTSSNTVYYVLIGVAAVVIIALIAAIVVVIKKRRA